MVWDAGYISNDIAHCIKSLTIILILMFISHQIKFDDYRMKAYPTSIYSAFHRPVTRILGRCIWKRNERCSNFGWLIWIGVAIAWNLLSGEGKNRRACAC